jgi:ribonuclease G
MTKELVISANVHEKKVAILEDGLVTEFYVERADENQGLVGNLYKGRVMKVLPGMQSAFVDIALERDAFLYVSDFAELMEDEELIEYKDLPEPRPDARQMPVRPAPPPPSRPRRDDQREDDRSRPGSFSRPSGQYGSRQGTAGPPSHEPARESAESEASQQTVSIQDIVEQLAEITDESVIPPPPTEEYLDAMFSSKTGTADTIGETELVELTTATEFTELEEPPDEVEASPELEPEAAPEVADEKPDRSRSRRKGARPEPPKTARRGKKPESKEVEKEPRAAGSQPAPVREPAPAKRGSRRRPAIARGEIEPAEGQLGEGVEIEGALSDFVSQSNFERVTDDDLAQMAGELLKDAIVQEKIIEQVHHREYQPIVVQREAEPQTRVGALRSQLGADPRFQRVQDEDEMSTREADLSSGSREGGHYQSHENAATDGYEPPQPDRHSVESEAADTDEPISEHSRDAESGDSPQGSTRTEESTQTSSSEDDGDREAEIRHGNRNAEFAIRRGGRGRRRRREPPPPVEEGAKTEAPSAVAEGAQAAPEEALPDQGNGGPRRLSPQAEPQPIKRPDFNPPPKPPMRRPDRGVPTISELLREGQEILVQIAKEPIAKKGARITSHIALPGRYLVYMPTVNHIGVSRKISSEAERFRLKRTVTALRDRESAGGGFIVRTACDAHSEQELQDDMRYLLRTWADIKKKTERTKSPALVHRDLDLVQRILRDHLSEEFTAIRVDNEVEYARLVEFVNRIQPKLVKRVKLYTGDQPILEKYGVQGEIDKAVKPRVWLKSGGYIVINQTEALVAIDVNTGKFVGKSDRLEDTITRTNLEAVKEIVRQIRLRDLGGIIVLDLIDMEERKNRQRVMAALQQELQADRAPSKILSINDFGLVAITRKRVKQSLERTLCTPCPYCQGGGLVKSPETMCFEILEQAKAISKQATRSSDVTLRVAPDVAEAFRGHEHEVFEEIEAYFSGPVTIEADFALHREQYDFAIV